MSLSLASLALLKKPTGCRFLAVAAAVVICSVWPTRRAFAAKGLSVQQAVTVTLAQSGWAQARAAAGRAAQARSRRASRWANPQLQFQRGEVPGVEVEQSLLVQQTVDLTGRRSKRSAAAMLRGNAAKLAIERQKQFVANAVQRVFYTRLAGQRRRAVLRDWARRLATMLDVVDKRLAAGTTSRYARLRLVREVRMARSQLARCEANIAAATHRLAAWMNQPPASLPKSIGKLLPGPPPGRPLGKRERADIRAAMMQTKASRLDADAAGRAKWPVLQLGLGWRNLAGSGASGHGYIVTLNATLPVFKRGVAGAASSRAQAAGNEAQLAVTRRSAQAKATAALTRWALLHHATVSFDTARRRDNPPMLAAADAGFVGGSLGVTGVLDAHRAATEDAVGNIALRASTRFAQLQWRLATGAGGPR